MKKPEKLIMPEGKKYDKADETANSEASEKTEKKDTKKEDDSETEEASVEKEAQTYYDEIMEEDPRICKALYELLKDKYEGEKESVKEKAAQAKSGDEEYDTEGMPA